MFLALAPKITSGMGLSNIELNSVFNEPFDAKIQLLSPTVDELDSFTVNLADSEAFARAKIDRPFILSELKFILRRSPDYISISSQKPIREPFLNFLIEVSWSNGRLFREYTVLLDPPQYNPNGSASESTGDQSTSYTSEAIVETDDTKARKQKADYANEFEQSSNSPSINYPSSDYGPTTRTDTLWSIASSMRPDSSISVNQMMSALFYANPEAFFNKNMNGLKRGQRLRMPNETEINALTNGEASTEVEAQNIAWSGIKNDSPMEINERPNSYVTLESPDILLEATTDFLEASEGILSVSELTLVPAKDASNTIEQVPNVDGGQDKNSILVKGLILDDDLKLPENLILTEDIQGLTDENMELQERMEESEAPLDDLDRLVSLKNNDLAVLQGQVAANNDIIKEEVGLTDEEIALDMEAASDEKVEIETVGNELLVEDGEGFEIVDEVVVDVIKSEVVSNSDGIMNDDATGTTTSLDVFIDTPNTLIAIIAVVLVLFVLILFLVIKVFRKKLPTSFENIDINNTTEKGVLPDLDSDSEIVTVSQLNSEDETLIALPEQEITNDEEFDSEAVTIFNSEKQSGLGTVFNSGIQSDSKKETDISKESVELDVMEEAALILEEAQDEDPMQEVNTYLAFEQFDQAEVFARDVMNEFPDNADYHMKLLEVFYTSANKESYEQEANVLYDKFGEDNENWDMVVAMWTEMSPNRSLFEKDVNEEGDDLNNRGGFVDITADGEARNEDVSLELDIVDPEEIPNDEDMLDISLKEKAESLLDVTLETSLEAESSESLSQRTDLEPESPDIDIQEEHETLELDMGASTEASDDNLLDFDMDEDGDLEIEISEPKDSSLEIDLATSEASDDNNLLDFDMSENENLETEIGESNDSSLEIDLATSEASDDNNLLDFDMSENENLETEIGESKDSGLETDLAITELGEDDILLDLDMDGDKGIESDISTEITDKTSNSELGMITDKEVETTQINSLDLELNIEDDMSLTLDETVEMIGNSDEDDDQIPFIPGASQAEEQTLENQVATKLDLLKAYVELGDKDSAKTISAEIMAVGNDKQRQQAEDLLGQI